MTQNYVDFTRICSYFQNLTSPGAKSLDIESHVKVFKAALFAWPEYDKELSALSVQTTRKWVAWPLSHCLEIAINFWTALICPMMYLKRENANPSKQQRKRRSFRSVARLKLKYAPLNQRRNKPAMLGLATCGQQLVCGRANMWCVGFGATSKAATNICGSRRIVSVWSLPSLPPLLIIFIRGDHV